MRMGKRDDSQKMRDLTQYFTQIVGWTTVHKYLDIPRPLYIGSLADDEGSCQTGSLYTGVDNH